MKYVFKNKLYIVIMATIDFFGYILSLPFKLLFGKKSFDAANILIIRLDHIGDFISTIPLFENTKSHFAEAKITVLINPALKDLAKKNPYIDEIILFQAPWLDRKNKKININQFINLVKRIRKEKFDLGIDSRGDLFSIILMVLAGIKYKTGYGVTGGGFFLDKEIDYDKNSHTIDRNLKVLNGLGIPKKTDKPVIYFDDDDKNFVEQILKDVKYNGKKAMIFHTSAGTQAKKWSRDKFAQLMQKLRSDGYEAFVVGTKDEQDAYDDVYDLRGRLSLPQLAYMIRRIGAFVGLDSGPANIAAALGVPTLVICSGTNIPENWMVKNQKTRIIAKNVKCKPCELVVCKYNEHYCMEQISAEEVAEEVYKLIG